MSVKISDINQLNLALNQLDSTDPAVQKKAARFIHRRSRDNWTIWKKEWFANEKTIKTLLKKLSTVEADTAIELVGALGNASQRYEIDDRRIHDVLTGLFRQAPKKLQIAIVQAIPQFGTITAWNLVFEILSNEPTAAAQHAAALAIARHGRTIEQSMRPKFTEVLLKVASKQKNTDLLDTIALALANTASPKDVPALRAWLEKTKNKFVRDTILQTIDACSKNK